MNHKDTKDTKKVVKQWGFPALSLCSSCLRG